MVARNSISSFGPGPWPTGGGWAPPGPPQARPGPGPGPAPARPRYCQPEVVKILLENLWRPDRSRGSRSHFVFWGSRFLNSKCSQRLLKWLYDTPFLLLGPGPGPPGGGGWGPPGPPPGPARPGPRPGNALRGRHFFALWLCVLWNPVQTNTLYTYIYTSPSTGAFIIAKGLNTLKRVKHRIKGKTQNKW